MKPPVKVNNQFYKLDDLKLDPKYIRYGILGFESERCLSVRDEGQDGQPQLTIVDISKNFAVTRKPTKVDVVLPHPVQNALCVRANIESNVTSIQCSDLNTNSRLLKFDFKDTIQLWKWVSETTLAIVSPTSVYHADYTKGDTSCVPIVQRVGPLAEQGCQVVSYSLDPAGKFSALVGISTPDGGKTINGSIQLCLIDAGKQQTLEGHAACFGKLRLAASAPEITVFCYAEKKSTETTSRMVISEINAVDPTKKFKTQIDFAYPDPAIVDFPFYIQVASRYGLLFMVTKQGLLYIFDIPSSSQILRSKISDVSIITVAKNYKTHGLIAVNKNGNLISIDIDDDNIVSFIQNYLKHLPDASSLARNLAMRAGLPGVEEELRDQFNKYMIAGDYKAAAETAAMSPGILLRNKDTIEKFKSLPQMPGQPHPVMQYFHTLTEKGKLNSIESIEVSRILLQLNKKDFIDKWMSQDKLSVSKELGDLINPYDVNMATDIYKKCGSTESVVTGLISAGKFDEVMNYANSTNYKVDYISLFKSLLSTNGDQALVTAKSLASQKLVNPHQIAEMFLQANRLQEMTNFLIECLNDDRPEDGKWQTICFELNLKAFPPQYCDSLLKLKKGKWTHYDKTKIAFLCESKGLLTHALENHTDIKEIRKLIIGVAMSQTEYAVAYLSDLQPEWSLVCLQDLMRSNRQNMNIVLNVAFNSFQKLGVAPIIKIFESAGAYDGIFLFLQRILDKTQDPEIYFKFIEAAAKCNQLVEVEKVIRQTEFYDPVKVKDFLKEIKLSDPKPLIYLCDKHGFIDELVKYLYKNNYQKYINIYVLRVNPQVAPQVLSSLIDVECEENQIRGILSELRSSCPPEPLVEEFEKRNRLRVLENWLEQRAAEGNTTPAIHNALAKITIDTDKDPQKFLATNQYYDSNVIGKYCENRDPHFAFTAYKRAWGKCDIELIELTNKHSMYKLQAKYLIERQSKELWATVLNPENPHRKNIIEQVVSAALPESKNVEEVSSTVKAFMDADLPLELISLLEKIVLHNPDFGSYKKLQNLLIVTAIRADRSKVMDYINRLDNYDGAEIAKVAMEPQHQLFEEAFAIYKKFNMHEDAADVLLNNLDSIERATEYSEKVNMPEIWSKLGLAYLRKRQIEDAINYFLKSSDSNHFNEVIIQAENAQKYEELIKYLLMARTKVKDVVIDNELIYCYAKTDKLGELENVINNPNSADIQKVGDKCYDDKLFEAAKLLYTKIKSNSRIASTLVHLKQFAQAIDAAKKANNPKTWMEVCKACITNGEYKLAAVAGQNVMFYPDHVEDIVNHYEKYGAPDEIILLLEGMLGLERSHIGMYTELGILYAKYKPEKLMEFSKSWFKKINIQKVRRVCERYCLWKEVVFLHAEYKEFESAIQVIIDHSPSCWNHEQFTTLIKQVLNTDMYYKAIIFYVEEQPLMLNDLLNALSKQIDHAKVVVQLKRLGYLPLITPWLKSVQSYNVQAVNDALNDIYLETDDFESLKQSVLQYENIEPLGVAKALATHDFIEFRRISAYIYRRQKKYKESLDISLRDKQYRDAIETSQESHNSDLIEMLLRYLVQNGEKEFFTVCLFTCYEHIRPETVVELSWVYGLYDYAMPFFVQLTKDLTTRVETVHKKNEEREKKEEKQAEQASSSIDIGPDFFPGLAPNMLGMQMLLPPMDSMGGMMPGMGGMMPGMFPGMMPGGMGGLPGVGGMNYGGSFH